MGARDLQTDVDADQLLASVWREFLAPPPDLSVTQWAELHRVLSIPCTGPRLIEVRVTL